MRVEEVTHLEAGGYKTKLLSITAVVRVSILPSLLHRNFVSYLESATTFSFNIFCGIGNHRKVDRSGQEVTLSASSKRLQTIPNIPLSLQV